MKKMISLLLAFLLLAGTALYLPARAEEPEKTLREIQTEDGTTEVWELIGIFGSPEEALKSAGISESEPKTGDITIIDNKPFEFDLKKLGDEYSFGEKEEDKGEETEKKSKKSKKTKRRNNSVTETETNWKWASTGKAPVSGEAAGAAGEESIREKSDKAAEQLNRAREELEKAVEEYNKAEEELNRIRKKLDRARKHLKARKRRLQEMLDKTIPYNQVYIQDNRGSGR